MILPDAGLFKLLTRRDRLQWFGLREAINNLSRSARSAVAYELSCALKRHKVDACADDTEDALETFALRLTMRLQDTTIERDFERHTVQAWATAPEAQRPMMPRFFLGKPDARLWTRRGQRSTVTTDKWSELPTAC